MTVILDGVRHLVCLDWEFWFLLVVCRFNLFLMRRVMHTKKKFVGDIPPMIRFQMIVLDFVKKEKSRLTDDNKLCIYSHQSFLNYVIT